MKLLRLLLSFWNMSRVQPASPIAPQRRERYLHRASSALALQPSRFSLLYRVVLSVPLPVHSDPSFPPAPSLNPQAH